MNEQVSDTGPTGVYVCTDEEHLSTRTICPCDAFDGRCHSCEDPHGVPSCMTLTDLDDDVWIYDPEDD